MNIYSQWWLQQHNKLLKIAAQSSPCYVYNNQILIRQITELLALQSIDQLFYAVKANYHPTLLNTLYKLGVNFECVSLDELQHIFQLFPEISPQRILFTPNFAPKDEYIFALKKDCILTIDSLYPLQQWSEIFANRKIFLRLDPGSGQGHHKHVQTGGDEAKFGISLTELPKLCEIISHKKIKITGLHVHSGSGIFTPDHWAKMALFLNKYLSSFPDVKIFNLGGGLGVQDRDQQAQLNLQKIDIQLQIVKKQCKNIKFWLEPGRFFVANCGVLLATVTQLKTKGKIHYIGINTGMNSLIRPALYESYHQIINLTKYDQPNTQLVNIVGPICESADLLGYQRLFPRTEEKDIILIANAGAYGYAMSSNYNMRPPATEIVLP